MDRHRPALTAALALAPVAFLGCFFAYPVVTLVATGLGEGGRWDLGAAADVVASPATRRVAWFTTWQAAASTAATLVAALPAAWVLARLDFPGRRAFGAALVVPFILPTVVVGTAFLSVLGPGGPLAGLAGWVGAEVDLRRGVPAIVAAHVFFNYAVVARTVGAAWAGLDRSAVHAARTLGATRLGALTTVTLPRLRPAIASAAAIVFLFTFTSFGVVKILGGPRLATLEVEVHRRTTESLDLRGAAVLSLLQLAAVVAALAVHARASGRVRGAHGTGATPAASPAPRRQARGVDRLVLGGVLATAAALLGAPVATLVWRSFSTADGLGLANYRTLGTLGRGSVAFVPPLEAVGNSLRFGLLAAVLATAIGASAALAVARLRGRWRSVADSGLMLPLGTSAVTVGLGFLLALDTPPLDLRTSPLLIPIAQALVALPFVLRTLLPALASVPDDARAAAATLGARPWTVWRTVDLPLLRRPLAVAFGFAFAMSLGEFGATVFIARADAPTVPVAIFRALGQPGALQFGQAMALSTVLVVLTAAVMVVVDRAGDAKVGGF